MLVARAHEAAAVQALAAHVKRRAREWDWVQWSGLRRDGTGIATLRIAAVEVPDAGRCAFVLPLPGSWEEFRAGLGHNVRESVRKCYNSLKRDGHAWRLTVAGRPDEIPAALERFFVLHKLRAGVAGTVAHADCFATPASRRFLADVCLRLAARGTVRVFQVEVGGQVVAARIGFVFGDRLYLYYSGYDPAWGKYSVMTTVVTEAFKYAIAAGLTSVNLSTGADRSKTRWRPSEIGFVDAVTPSPGGRSRLTYQAFELATRWREARHRTSAAGEDGQRRPPAMHRRTEEPIAASRHHGAAPPSTEPTHS
jgi:CelD/BcsL family acetyltransferase involved in cellulose biosynthesis